MARKVPGIRRRRGRKPEAWVNVTVNGRPKQITKTFDEDTSDEVMTAWRTKQEKEHKPIKLTYGTFAADVDLHCLTPKIAAQSDTRRLLLLWVAVLGADRNSDEITTADIDVQLKAWLREGLAEPTVYHRRSALSTFFTERNGAAGVNPVRGSFRPKPWVPRDQSVPFDTVVRILATMPDTRRLAKGITVPSEAKIVATVLAHTGVRPANLLDVREHDVNWKAATVRMPPCKGAPEWTLRLTPTSLAAFRKFHAAKLYGNFNEASVSVSFKRAARRVDGEDTQIHLYCLRHSVGADLYRETRDLATVGRRLGHVPGSPVTAQYAVGANDEVDLQAMNALETARTAAAATVPPLAVPTRYRAAAAAAAKAAGLPQSRSMARVMARNAKRSIRRKLRKVV